MDSPKQYRETYLQHLHLWERAYEQHQHLRSLTHALHRTAYALNDLAFDVGLYQRLEPDTEVSSQDPRVAVHYKNLLLMLRSLRRAVEPIDREVAALYLPSKHGLDVIDLFEGALLCREHAHIFGEALALGAFLNGEEQEASKALTHAVMVRIGKVLHIDYDFQARLLAAELVAGYSGLPPEGQAAKRRTLEKELKAAFRRPMQLKGEALIAVLPRMEQHFSFLLGRVHLLGWILQGLPPRQDEDHTPAAS